MHRILLATKYLVGESESLVRISPTSLGLRIALQTIHRPSKYTLHYFSPHLVAHSHSVFLHFRWNSGAIICHEPQITSEALSCSKNGQGETSEDLFLLTRNLYNTGAFSCGTCGGSKTSISTPSQPESYADSGRRVRPGPTRKCRELRKHPRLRERRSCLGSELETVTARIPMPEQIWNE